MTILIYMQPVSIPTALPTLPICHTEQLVHWLAHALIICFWLHLLALVPIE